MTATLQERVAALTAQLGDLKARQTAVDGILTQTIPLLLATLPPRLSERFLRGLRQLEVQTWSNNGPEQAEILKLRIEEHVSGLADRIEFNYRQRAPLAR